MMLPENIHKRGAINKPFPKNSFRVKMTDDLRRKIFGSSASWDRIKTWLTQHGSGVVVFDNDYAFFSKEELALMFDLRWSYND